MTFEETLRQRVDQFYADLLPLIHADILNRLANVGLDVPTAPQLPPPRRRARPRLPAPKKLTREEQRALTTLQSADGPLSSREVAHRLLKAESTVRFQLSKLVQKQAVRRREANGRVLYLTT